MAPNVIVRTALIVVIFGKALSVSPRELTNKNIERHTVHTIVS